MKSPENSGLFLFCFIKAHSLKIPFFRGIYCMLKHFKTNIIGFNYMGVLISYLKTLLDITEFS